MVLAQSVQTLVRWPWPALAHTWQESLIFVLCVFCALYPRRGILGSALVLGFSAMFSLVRSFVYAGAPRSVSQLVKEVSSEMVFALFVLAIVQGFRLFRGWRIIGPRDPATRRGGQFQIAELLEWMLACAILLGLNSISGSRATASANDAAMVLVNVVALVLFGLPATYLLLSRRLRLISFVLWALWAMVATVIWIFGQALYISLDVVLALSSFGAWGGLMLWCFLTMHLVALRWLGFRWS
jgi:hypothetical protein